MKKEYDFTLVVGKNQFTFKSLSALKEQLKHRGFFTQFRGMSTNPYANGYVYRSAKDSAFLGKKIGYTSEGKYYSLV